MTIGTVASTPGAKEVGANHLLMKRLEKQRRKSRKKAGHQVKRGEKCRIWRLIQVIFQCNTKIFNKIFQGIFNNSIRQKILSIVNII